MDVRFYLSKAQEADAIANATENKRDRRHWESIAAEYRRLAKAETDERGLKRPEKLRSNRVHHAVT
ncbi:MAG TPA: hypothetical protein VH088_00665 [Terriglobales bacterium]|nr:hypothetical protein [Terriglobales bacterium]